MVLRYSKFFGLTMCLGMLATASYAETTAFSTDFNSTLPTEFTGVTSLESTQSFSGIGGFSGNFLRNNSGGNPAGTTVLTLTGLPPHNTIRLKFLLAIIDTWDGDNPTWGPDYFNVKVDGVQVFSETISAWTDQYDPGSDQSFRPLSQSILSYDSDLGFETNPDVAFDMGYDPALTFSHTGSTLTVEWYASGGGWQGGVDESWAIDNVEVILDPEPLQLVPIPTMSAWALSILAALLGIMGLRRRVS